MSALDRKLIRDLWAVKGLLAGIVVLMTLGVACFCALRMAYASLEAARVGYYAEYRLADFWLDLKRAPITATKKLLEIEGVAKVEPRLSLPILIDLPGVDRPLGGMVYSLPRRHHPMVNSIHLTKGTYFGTARVPELIVSRAFAKARQLDVGDRLQLLIDRRKLSFVIVGIALGPEFVYTIAPGGLIPEPENYGIVYGAEDYLADLFGYQGACNQFVGTFTPPMRHAPRPILAEIERRLEEHGLFTAIPRAQQASHLFLNAEMEGLKKSATFLPGVFLLVAALVLNVLLQRIAEQQRTVIGTLKALGYNNGQVIRHYLKFGLVVGTTSGLLGIIVGTLLAYVLVLIYAQYFEFPALGLQFVPGDLILGLMIGQGCALLGTWRGVRIVLHLSPAAAMRARPPVTGRRVALENWPWLWKRLDFGWRLVFRGIARNRLRVFAGLCASALGTAITLTAFFAFDAIFYLVDFQFTKVVRADVEIYLHEARGSEVLSEVRRLPQVGHCEPTFVLAGTFYHEDQQRRAAIVGIQPNARLLTPRDGEANSIAVPKVGVLMSRQLAKMLRVVPGDVLTFIPSRGDRAARQVPLVAVNDSYLGLTVYADFYWLNRIAGEYEAITSLQILAVHDAQELTPLYRALKQLPGVQVVTAFREQRAAMMRTLVMSSRIMVVMTILFAGAIFFGSILNNSLTSLSEREGEIATLRVLGYSWREIGGLFARESLLVNGVGVALGMPLGYGLCALMVTAYETELYQIPLVILPRSWLIVAFTGPTFVLLSHAVIQRVLDRFDWRSAMKTKE